MLTNLSKLEKLHCVGNLHLTGNLKNIRVLRESLKELRLSGCKQVQGSLKDISDFPKLKSVCLQNTKITGDIRDIGPNDFVSVEYVDELYLGEHVYGGNHIPSIEEAPEIMLAWSRLTKRNPNIYIDLKIPLSLDSTQRYNIQGHPSRIMPAKAEFVRAGNRLGWRWTNGFVGGSCETHWIDPEPDQSEHEYDDYSLDVYRIEKDVEFFRGCFVPPTVEEHRRRSAEVPFNPRLTWYGIPRYS